MKSIFHHFQTAFICQKLSQTWECAFKTVNKNHAEHKRSNQCISSHKMTVALLWISFIYFDTACTTKPIYLSVYLFIYLCLSINLLIYLFNQSAYLLNHFFTFLFSLFYWLISETLSAKQFSVTLLPFTRR